MSSEVYKLVLLLSWLFLFVIVWLAIGKSGWNDWNIEKQKENTILQPSWVVTCWWIQIQIEDFYKMSKVAQKRFVEKCQDDILSDEVKMMKEVNREKEIKIQDFKNILSK